MERRRFIGSVATFAAAVVAFPLASVLEARIGRPATPASIAGVRRRTRRRVRRRVVVGMSLTALPYGCTATRVAGGITYNYCGGIWYQPMYQGTNVVYVVHDIEPGAETNVEFEE